MTPSTVEQIAALLGRTVEQARAQLIAEGLRDLATIARTKATGRYHGMTAEEYERSAEDYEQRAQRPRGTQ